MAKTEHRFEPAQIDRTIFAAAIGVLKAELLRIWRERASIGYVDWFTDG